MAGVRLCAIDRGDYVLINEFDFRICFAETARQWADDRVPYKHRGTDRNGCDCTGLLIGIARELGYLNSYKLRQYGTQWNLHAGAGNQAVEEIEKFADLIDNKAAIGDIAVMRFGKCPAHCGIIVDCKGLMVHSLKTNDKVTYGMLRNSPWSKRWIATYRTNITKIENYV